MMKQTSQPFIGASIMVNNQLISNPSFDAQKMDMSNAAYEVLRVMQGKPLFLEDHLLRFEKSIKFMGTDVGISGKEIAEGIQKLSKANGFSTGNVKLIFTSPPSKKSIDEPILLIAFISHKYPDKEDYSRGITMHSLKLERPNPNAKIIREDINNSVNNLKSKTGADEILLVNHDGVMTEGSKSNIFFIEKNQILTAERPLVLAGITRDKILEICYKARMAFEEGKPKLENLKDFSAAFITGTSPRVMPVRQIDDMIFDTNHPIILKLQKAYDKMIEAYLADFDTELLARV